MSSGPSRSLASRPRHLAPEAHFAGGDGWVAWRGRSEALAARGEVRPARPAWPRRRLRAAHRRPCAPDGLHAPHPGGGGSGRRRLATAGHDVGRGSAGPACARAQLPGVDGGPHRGHLACGEVWDAEQAEKNLPCQEPGECSAHGRRSDCGTSRFCALSGLLGSCRALRMRLEG